MIKIRVTIDIDSNNKIVVLWSLLKGLLLLHRFPDEIERTRRGIHYIWHGLDIDFKKHFVYRKFIGDDENRIRLDMHPKRIGQVLFTGKEVFINEKGEWKPVKYCDVCSKPLTEYWTWRPDKYYCIRCGSGNVKVLKAVHRRREKLFNNFLKKISKLAIIKYRGEKA
jgi:hypothetical protein